MESAVNELNALIDGTPPPPGALTLAEVERAFAAARPPDPFLERRVEGEHTKAGRARALARIAFAYSRAKRYDLAVEPIEAAHKLSPRVVTRAMVDHVLHVAEVAAVFSRVGANRIVDERMVQKFYRDYPPPHPPTLLAKAVNLLRIGVPMHHWTRAG